MKRTSLIPKWSSDRIVFFVGRLSPLEHMFYRAFVVGGGELLFYLI